MALYEDSDFYKNLLDQPEMDFLIYYKGKVIFGGKYAYDLNAGTPDQARENCEAKLDILFNKAILAINTMPFPY